MKTTITDPQSVKIDQRYRFFIVLLVIVGLLLGYILYQFWPTLLMKSIQWQKVVVSQLSDILYTSKLDWSSFSVLIKVSLIYGILHSLGPGHGKVVVNTYIATHNSKLKLGIAITVISALLQAITAIAVVSGMLFVIDTTMKKLNLVVVDFIHASFVAVFLLGGYIAIQSLRHRPSHVRHSHVHNDGVCSCGHKHQATSNELNTISNWQEFVLMVLSIGIRPCTGAILVLFLSSITQQFWIGILSVFAMALGTAFTTSTIAVMTVAGKRIVYSYLTTSTYISPYWGIILRFLVGVMLMLMAVLFYQVNQYAISPLFAK
ncbi:nickel/cobalt transporter [Vibrio mediterranei]